MVPGDIPSLKAEFFKALAHPLRIRILELLSEEERSVSALLERIAVEQPQLSQQLAVLRRADLVDARREGARVVYSIADPRIADLLAVSKDILLDIVTATGDALRAS